MENKLSTSRLNRLQQNFLYVFDTNFRRMGAQELFHNFCICACLNGPETAQLRQHLQNRGVL